MIEYNKLYRILAVQREGEADDTPTRVIHAHALGAASRDTLSPVLTAMGADLSHQQVIQKRNNVILEEISGFYYLSAFWQLTNEKQEAYFIAATGANNVEAWANMFLGWGLEFIIAIDDDNTGRGVYRSIKKNMFGDDENSVKAKVFRIDGAGIEDVFSKADFKKFVLKKPDVNYDEGNSQYVKSTGESKAILAYQFSIEVTQGAIKLMNLDTETRGKIKELVKEIRSRLSAKGKA